MPNSSLGWATILHPYHPFRGQRFEVLKTRRVAGIETLILRHPDRGSYAVAQEWTDWAQSAMDESLNGAALLFDAELLIELTALLEQLEVREQGGLDE